MARIVCQVLQRADSITFIWSEGAATFEPYHLEGAERANLLQVAGRIHAQLAAGADADLRQLGQQLYRAVLRRDASKDAAAEAVHGWLMKLIASNSIEKLEFLSDAPGLIPWNVLSEEGGTGCWGTRFNLGAGRRVNALRQNPTQVKPTQLAAADPDLVQQLSVSQQALLNPLHDAGKLVHKSASLQDELRQRAPDILLLLVHCDKGRLRLGADSFSVYDLQRWLEEPKEGNPDPLVILMASGDAAEQSAWHKILGAASASFSGLVANEVLLSPADAFSVGHTLAQRFAEGKQSLGESMRTLRQEHGAAALAFSVFCPPQVRVVMEDAADAPVAELPVESVPLPRLPYRPFGAFEVEDRALLFGREEDVLRGAMTIDQADAVGVFLHGSPAVGKTSYLQAGLLPYLEQECIGYRVLRDRSPLEPPGAEKDYPILILRCTSDLAGQFADALSAFCAPPFAYTTPAGTQVTVDLPRILQQTLTGASPVTASSTAIQSAPSTSGITTTPADSAEDAEDKTDGVSARDLWMALRDNTGLLAAILDAVARPLPFELVIAVDQGEELLTMVRSVQQQARRQKALDMLMGLSRQTPRCKIVFTMRSQSLGQLFSLLPDGRAPADWRTFGLRSLTEAEMVDALLWPTNREEISYCGEIPAQKYGFTFEDGMAAQLVADAFDASAAELQSPLPLVQAAGALLYDRQVVERKQDTLHAADIKDLGGVKNALGKYLDRTLERLAIAKQSRQALRELLAKLYIGHADGTLSRDVIPASDLKSHWTSQVDPVEPIVNLAAEEQGLFEIQELLIAGQPDTYVSLPQDSLAQLGKKIAAERDLQTAARTKMIDVLWIMIPLMFVGAAITFWGTRHYTGKQIDELLEKTSDDKKALIQKAQEIIEQNDAQAKRAIRDTRPPQYYGLLAQADLALRGDNALRARQLLLSQPAVRAYAETQKENMLPDLRGFEWKYLWRHLNSERHLLEGHRGVVTSVAVAHDSQRAASASIDGSVRVWNLTSGEVLALIPGTKAPVHAVAFAPDGKTLASAGADKIVRLWDLSELKSDYVEITKEKAALAGHGDAIHTLAFGKDADTLASAGADKLVIVWEKGKEKNRFKEHAAAIRALAFSTDGKTLVSAGDQGAGGDFQFFVYDADAGKKRLDGKTAYRSIAALSISADGKTLCTGGIETRLDADQGMLRFWNLADAKETLKPITHGAGVLAVALSPDGKSVASGGRDHMVRLWNIQAGEQKRKWIGHLGAVACLAFAKDESALVSGGFDASVKVWNPAQSSGPDVIAAHDDWVQALVLNRKNTLLASGARDGSVKLWDARTGKLAKALPTHKGAVTALAFANHKDKEPTFLAVGTRDDKDQGEIKIWQIDDEPKQGVTAKELHALTGHAKGITGLSFHPNADKADILISGSADKTVKVWDAKAGKEQASHAGHKDEVRCVAFSFDGTTFASGGKDALVCFYELEKKEIRTLADLHLGSIESLALFNVPMTGDDHVEFTGLLTGSADQSMRMWAYDQHDPQAAGKTTKISAQRTHVQPIACVVHHKLPGSALVASASWDGTIKLYDLYTERFTLTGHQGPVRALAVAADQSFVASAGNDGTVRIWRAAADRGMAKMDKEQK